MTTTYGTCRTTQSGFTATAVSGGSLSGSGTLYLSLQARTRQGYNLHSSIQTVSYTAGQRIECTIASGAIAAGELGSIHELVISGSATNSTTGMKRLASWTALQPDQTTTNSLPTTIYLSTDAHIALSTTVANTASLPSGSDRVQGMIRYVTAIAKYLKYDADATSGEVASSPGCWVEYDNWTGSGDVFSTYIGTTTTASGGCDFAIQSVPDADVIAVPAYTPDGSESTPVRVVIQNTLTEGSGGELLGGQPLGVVLAVDGQNQATQFSSLLYARYLGKFRKLDGTLNTSDDDVGVDKAIQLYVAPGTNVSNSNLYLPETIELGYGALFEFFLKFDADDVVGLTEGSSIKLYVYPQGESGSYNPASAALGNVVLTASFSPDQRLRITPNAAGLIQSGTGAGSIASYDFSREYVKEAPVTVADTADQKVAIKATDRGGIIVRQPADTLLEVEALRALISTTVGTYAGSGWSSNISVSGGGAIQVTVTYPTAIRSTYPDVIASTTAFFNVPKLRVFVDDGSDIYEQSNVTVTPSVTSQQFTITSLAGSPVSLPTPSSDPAFCLFGYPSAPSGSDVGGGSLTAGTYRVQVYYYFPSPNTAVSIISHDTADGCMAELSSTLSEAISNTDLIPLAVANLTALRAIATPIPSYRQCWVASEQSNFVYDPNLIEVENGQGAIKPNSLADTDPGRWVIIEEFVP